MCFVHANGSRINCQQRDGEATSSLSRRSMLSLAAAVVPVMSASSAFALLDSDEDLELLSKIKESRKRREASQTEAKNYQDESGEKIVTSLISCRPSSYSVNNRNHIFHILFFSEMPALSLFFKHLRVVWKQSR